MPLTIPLRPDLPYFDLQATLDGTTYTLELRWNVRAAGWYLGVQDATSTAWLIAPRRVCADFPIALYTVDRQPPGLLVPVDTSGAHQDPGLSDLGRRVVLLYFTAAELGLSV